MPNPKRSPQHLLLTCSKPSPVYKIPGASQLGNALSPQLHSRVCSSSASSMALPLVKAPLNLFTAGSHKGWRCSCMTRCDNAPGCVFPLQTAHHRPMGSPCGLQVFPAGQEFLLTQHSRGAWMRRGEEAIKAFERPESCQISCAGLSQLH